MPERSREVDPAEPLPLLRVKTDRFGFPLTGASGGSAGGGHRRRGGAAEGRVLVWSSGGRRRATTIAAAYLVAFHGFSAESAVVKIGGLRPCGDLQPAFVSALGRWERLQASSRYRRPPDSPGKSLELVSPSVEVGHGALRTLAAGTMSVSLAGTGLPTSETEELLELLPASSCLSSLMSLNLTLCPLTYSAAESIAALLRHSDCLLDLNLFGAGLSDAALAIVIRSLIPTISYFEQDELPRSNRSLRTLNVSRNSVGSETKGELILLVRRNCSLESLVLDACGINDADFLGLFFERLTQNSRSATHHISLNENDLSAISWDSLLLASRGQLNSLSLCRCKIDISTIKATNLNCLLVDGNSTTAGYYTLAMALASNEELTTLSLSACNLGPGCFEILEAIAEKHSESAFTTLDIAQNCVGREAGSKLGKLLYRFNHLLTLNLGSCELKTKGATAVLLGLHADSLLDLDLSDNEIHDSCTDSLCAFLERAYALRRLNISFNQITKEVADRVVECLTVSSATDTKLRTVNLSINTEGNPCGANAFGCPFLCRSKVTTAYKS